MSTPCCQISTHYRLVVPKLFCCKSRKFFWVHPVVVALVAVAAAAVEAVHSSILIEEEEVVVVLVPVTVAVVEAVHSSIVIEEEEVEGEEEVVLSCLSLIHI